MSSLPRHGRPRRRPGSPDRPATLARIVRIVRIAVPLLLSGALVTACAPMPRDGDRSGASSRGAQTGSATPPPAATPAPDPASLPFGGAETLTLAPPDGWTETHRQESGGVRVLHLMPADQDPDDWRDMMTVQILKTADPPTLEDLYARAVASYDAECTHSLGGTLQTGEANGYPTGFWTLGCSHNAGMPGAMGETSFFKAVRGGEGMYVVQRAWRLPAFDAQSGPPIPQEAQQEAIRQLQGAVVCVPGNAAHPCP